MSEKGIERLSLLSCRNVAAGMVGGADGMPLMAVVMATVAVAVAAVADHVGQEPPPSTLACMP